MAILRREEGPRPGGSVDWRAILLGLALVALVLLAHLARLAEGPVAGRTGSLAGFGPGPMGQLRAVEFPKDGAPPAGTAALARAALPVAPLAYEPFFALAATGFDGPRAAGTAREEVLLREALRRNPRSRETRLFLMRNAVGTGRLAGAIDQIAQLNRLSGGTAAPLMEALGAAIRSEKQVDEAVAALGPYPDLLRSFVSGFDRTPKPPALYVRLATRIPDVRLADRATRTAAVDLLVAAGEFGEARRMWSRGVSQPTSGTVYSPDFADAGAVPPFNWKLEENKTGAAERVAGGGVNVAYYGRDPGPLVAQVVTLPAGAWVARLDYTTLSGKPGAVGLAISCIGSQQVLGEAPLDARVNNARKLELSFSVPAEGCRGQSVALVGRTQLTRDGQEVLARRLDIARKAAP